MAAKQIQAVGGIGCWYNQNTQTEMQTTEVIDMKYTAIIKDGGLFIPNVFSDLNDGGAHIVQVEIDLEEVRQQLSKSEILETAVTKKSVAKDSKKSTAKTPTTKPSTTKPSTAKLSTAKTPKKKSKKKRQKN